MDFMLDMELFDSNEKCKIRSVYLKDNGWLFSVYDFINLACGRDKSDNYAYNFWYEYNKSNGKSGLTELRKHVFPKGNNKSTPVGSIRDLQKILLLLPGESGKKYRNLSENTISRIIAGDQTLHNIIDENHKSTNFLNETMRDTLNKDPIKEEDKIESILRGKIDKLKIKNDKLKIKNIELKSEIQENKIDLKNKDKIIQNKDKIIENKDSTIEISIRDNSLLIQRNADLTDNNEILIENYALTPENDELIEYLIILRKNKENYAFDSREPMDNETANNYLNTTYKHYVIRCQYRLIQRQITNFKNNYNLRNIYILFSQRNPNPGIFTHFIKAKTNEFIDNTFGNHLKIIDETLLLEYIRNYNDNIPI
jgi:hypothetical protein